jgi:hypothetical protein
MIWGGLLVVNVDVRQFQPHDERGRGGRALIAVTGLAGGLLGTRGQQMCDSSGVLSGRSHHGKAPVIGVGVAEGG